MTDRFSFDCKTGCDGCCGPVPFTDSEKASAQKVRPFEQWEAFGKHWIPASALTTMTCPFSRNGCEVYETRPMVCRLFGAVDNPRMKCPHGCGAKKLLTDAEAAVLLTA
jgi:uncharacterized protein